MLIDTHCHLDFPEFDSDRREVIQRAKQGDVGYIINIGSSLRGSQTGVDLAGRFDCVYASVGIHPHEADNTDEQAIKDIQELSEQAKVVAIGEIGLDYYKGLSSAENQKQLFRTLLDLAKLKSLPIIIHCRQAQTDTLKILKDGNITRALLHCFSGDERFLKECLESGFLISYTCNITYKKAEGLKALVKITPLDKLLLETDAPFLPPEGFRGKRNEPLYVKYLAQEISRIKKISVEEVAKVTTENAKDFFKLK